MFSLFDLNEYIRRVLALNFRDPVWINAEIAVCKPSRGHFYFDLVQKGEEEIVAQAAAVLWANTYRKLRLAQGLSLDEVLQEGVEVKMLVRVDFHERYGLKLLIEDVDTAYTFGKMELQRRQTIELLRSENLLEANRSLPLPLSVQRVAVVSSEDAAGWQDFREHLEQNAFGYHFHCRLFHTAMQGQKVEAEFESTMAAIARQKEKFDVVVVIRGGGSRLDLAAFDQLAVARAIAKMPLPVLTGIGHDIDETVADLVAHVSLKTPTAVADFLLQHQLFFENSVLQLGAAFQMQAQQVLQFQSLELDRLEHTARWSAENMLKNRALQVNFLASQIPILAKQTIRSAVTGLQHAEQVCAALHPDAVLRRGFGIVRKNGKALRSRTEVVPGDRIDTELYDGTIPSVVE